MPENNNKSSFDIKSLLFTGATLGPIAIGLGVGARDGFSNVRSNKSFNDLITGGKPSQIEMVGKSLGIDVLSSLRQARTVARGVVKKETTDLFTAAARSTGPQRSALISAMRQMLNSPYLDLTENQIANEMSSITNHTTGMAGADFDTFMNQRMEKYATDFGPGRKEEFFNTLRSTYEKNLKIHGMASLPSAANILNYTPTNLVQLNNIDPQEVLKGSFGPRPKERLDLLEKMLASAGINPNSGYKINQVGRGDTSALIATIKTNSATFDVPLSLRRPDMLKSAKGGIMHLSQGGKFTTEIVIPSAIRDLSEGIVPAEDLILERLPSYLGRLKGATSNQARRAAEEFKTTFYDTGQVLSKFRTEVQEATAFMHGFRAKVFSKGGNFTPGNEVQERILFNNPNVKYIGLPPGALAGDIPYVMDINAPTQDVPYEAFRRITDTRAKARLHQQAKPFTIFNDKFVLNDIMDWHESTQVGLDNLSDSSAAMNLVKKQSAGKFSALAFYQFEETLDENWVKAANLNTSMKELGIYEGGGIGTPRRMGTVQHYKFLPEISTSSGKGQSPLLQAIISAQQKTKPGEQAILTRKELRNITKNLRNEAKSAGLRLSREDLLMLGPDVDNMTKYLGFNFRKHAGMRIMGMILDDKGQYNLSVEFMNQRAKTMKVYGHGAKTTIIQPQAGLIASELTSERGMGKTIGGRVLSYLQRLNPKKVAERATMILPVEQLMRSPGGLQRQMTVGAIQMMSASGVNPGAIKAIYNKIRGLERDKLAGTIIQELEATGHSADEIANVVGAYTRSEFVTNRQSILGFSSSPEALSTAIRNTRGVIGIETMGAGMVGTGSGKPGSLERRSLNALYQHFKTQGLSQSQIVNMMKDFTRRAGPTSNVGEKFLTNQMFTFITNNFKGKGQKDQLKNFFNEFGIGFKEDKISIDKLRKLGELNTSSEWYNKSTLLNVSVDSNPVAQRIAKEVFGTDELVLPGARGLPQLSDINIKRDERTTKFATEYDKSLNEFLQTVASPHTSESEMRSAMGGLKSSLTKGYLISTEQMFTGKIAGSSQGDILSLNKANISKRHFDRLSEIARKDGYQTVFTNDNLFMNAIKNQMQWGKRQFAPGSKGMAELRGDLEHKIRQYVFNSGKINKAGTNIGGGVYGAQIRHPTLGEGHVSLATFRRFGGAQQNQQLLSISAVRKHVMKELGLKDAKDLTNKRFSQFLHRANKEQQQSFTKVLLSNLNEFQGGNATMYLPSVKGTISINGNVVPHEFSRFLRQYADIDGDTGTMILNFLRQNIPIFRMLGRSGKAFESAAIGEAEFMAMKKQAMAKTNLNMSEMDQLFQGKLKEVYGKRVGAFSESLDTLKASVLAFGKDENLTRQGVQSLTILEEILLKAKKADVAVDIATQFSKAVRSGNKSDVRKIIAEQAFEQGWNREVAYNIDGKVGRTLIDFESIFDNIWDSYQEYKSQGGNNSRSFKAALRRLDKGQYDTVTDYLIDSLKTGSHNLLSAAGASVSGVSTERSMIDAGAQAAENIYNTLAKGIGSKKFLIPAALGVGAALMITGVRSRVENPMRTPENTFANTAASALENSVNPNMRPPIDKFQPDPSKLIGQETYLSEEDSISNSVRNTFNDVSRIPQMNKILSSTGFKNNSYFIQDNRRAITRNYLDQLEEN